MNIDILKQAILDKRCLTARYEGSERHFAPHALGLTSKGTPATFVFQYGGGTTTALPRGGEWRCFHLDQLSGVRENRDHWRTPRNYSLSRQICLAEIVLAVPEKTTTSW
jgi:hypothetical protein